MKNEPLSFAAQLSIAALVMLGMVGGSLIVALIREWRWSRSAMVLALLLYVAVAAAFVLGLGRI